MSEKAYRVWVEQHQAGWVDVCAPSEEIAKDRAQDSVERGSWSPESSSVTPLTVEMLEKTE